MEMPSRILDYLRTIPLGNILAIFLSFSLGGIQLLSAHWIKEEESNHPAYKLEKVVWGAVFIGSGMNLLLGTSQYAIWFRNFTSLILILASLVAFFFIRYRKDNPLFQTIRLRTQKGIRLSGSFKENNQRASEVAALIRHDRSNGGEIKLLSDWSIAEIVDALAAPLKDDWVGERNEEIAEKKRLREVLEQRREAAADPGETVEVEPKEGV